jgi:hypothetical protein
LSKSCDCVCGFIFWFPLEINTEEMRKQLSGGTESVQAGRKSFPPVPFCD